MGNLIWLHVIMYLTPTLGSRILGLFPVPRESNFIMYEAIMKELALRGHEVDVVSFFSQKSKVPRYTDIDLSENFPLETYNLTYKVVYDYDVLETAKYLFVEYGIELCDKLTKHPKIINLAKSSIKYDLIIAEVFGTDCLLGFAYVFKAPIVGVLGDILTPWANDRMGNPDNPSYLPNYLLPFRSKMILEDRILNTLSGVLYKIGWLFLSVIPSELRSRELFGPDVTAIDVLAYNTSLLLVNSHFSVNFPRPMVPNVIEVAGIHIKNPKPLPEKLKKFTTVLKSLIYVVLDTKAMSREKISTIVEVLSSFRNPVIWRGQRNDIVGQLPTNIYVDDNEFDRVDVLCNENSGLLLTNGDIFILQEAIYCGVPVIGIPLTADHEIYIRDYVHRAWAQRTHYDDVLKIQIEEAINSVLKNMTYKQNAKEISKIFKDRPLKPLDEAIYWIEYVMRHGGAKHLRTVGADLIWLEYYNIDVALVYMGFVMINLAIAYFLYYLYMKWTTATANNSKKEK